MKTPSKPDNALRNALANIAQRQPSPPEGMADRFMARLAEEQRGEKTEQISVQEQSNPLRTLQLAMRWTSVAAAAAVVAAVILWAPRTEDFNPTPLSQSATATIAQTAENTSVPHKTSTQNKPSAPVTKTEIIAQSEPLRKDKPLAKPKAATRVAEQQQIVAIPTVQQQPVEVQQNQVKEDISTTTSATVITADNTQKRPDRDVAEVHKQRLPSNERFIVVYQKATRRDVTANFTKAERELDARATNADYRIANLIAGEQLAVESIIIRESLSAQPDIFQYKETNQPKPIRI